MGGGELADHYEIDTIRQWHISPIDGRIFYSDEQILDPEIDY
jgi:hypothetical protein